MLFNALEFAIFLPLVFGLFWAFHKANLRVQNLFLLAASYVFYGWWDYRFLGLIALSTGVDFILGLQLHRTEQTNRRKALLALSLVVNLGLLGFFKYYNFFIGEFSTLLSQVGVQVNPLSLKIILPVGISFYTFQTLSYTLDVYRKKITPTKDWVVFAAYVSFFPQLVAGPIERAQRLLPQFTQRKQWKEVDFTGAYQRILWGLFKKMVIADQAAPLVNEIFGNYGELSSPELILGAILFAFQIYGDFSGYSDIAIGTARLFGFDLMTNFKMPYFARDIAEFWRRWHISLSTWFRDYLYIPLGGSKGGRWKTLRNVSIVFLVSGFWHGANWTFLAWGAIHALLFIPNLILQRNRRFLDPPTEKLPSLRQLIAILSTFALVTLAWVFFRAENIQHAGAYLHQLATAWHLPGNFRYFGQLLWGLIAFLLLVEWRGQTHAHALGWLKAAPRLRVVLEALILYLLFTEGVFLDSATFIYFQF